MTSWIRAAPRSNQPPPRFGYFQRLPEGTFDAADTCPATVVTAYYEMKSKYPPAKYREWIARFLRTLTCPIVFFTDAETLPFLESCPKASSSVEFVVLPRSEWKANDPQRFPPRTWEQQHAIDPERGIHSPELYKVWYEKKEFVLRAIERNPFGSTKFVWTDAGVMRHPEFELLLRGRYPNPARIPTDRMMILNYWHFVEADEKDVVFQTGAVAPTRRGVATETVTIRGGGKDKPRLGGGVFAATAAVWRQWSALYDDAVRRYLKAGLFIGKDQTLHSTVTLEHKGLVSLIDLKKIAPEPWFYALLYLSVPDRVWQILRLAQADKEQWSYGRFVEECGAAVVQKSAAALPNITTSRQSIQNMSPVVTGQPLNNALPEVPNRSSVVL